MDEKEIKRQQQQEQEKEQHRRIKSSDDNTIVDQEGKVKEHRDTQKDDE